jgi:hypothetical protein
VTRGFWRERVQWSTKEQPVAIRVSARAGEPPACRAGSAPNNRKRVDPPMLHNKPLTGGHTRKPRGGCAHESKVTTILSNLRWNLGGFEISRWDGGVVWMIFLIDTCNWEIIDRATTTGRCL